MAIKVSKAKQRVAAPLTRSFAEPQNMLGLNGTIDQLLRIQGEVLRTLEPSVSGWLTRRREGMTAALLAGEKLVGCRDLNALFSIQREFIDGVVKRLDSDVRALTDQALNLSHCAIAAAQQATQAVTEFTIQPTGRAPAEPVAHPQETEEVVARAPHLSQTNAAEPPPAKAA